MKKELPIRLIKQWLDDSDWCASIAAMNACQGKDVPLDIIRQWLEDGDWKVRAAAMNACQGKDVPLYVIKQGLKDSCCAVRIAAMYACKENGIEIPASRTVEPPEKVYKKCVYGAIVEAHIPDDAHTRGTEDGKCRASKAIITDVICDKYPEKVAVSLHDNSVIYEPGDVIEIDDFDLSNEVCSTGFHFFCTKEQAEAWI